MVSLLTYRKSNENRTGIRNIFGMQRYLLAFAATHCLVLPVEASQLPKLLKYECKKIQENFSIGEDSDKYKVYRKSYIRGEISVKINKVAADCSLGCRVTVTNFEGHKFAFDVFSSNYLLVLEPVESNKDGVRLYEYTNMKSSSNKIYNIYSNVTIMTDNLLRLDGVTAVREFDSQVFMKNHSGCF